MAEVTLGLHLATQQGPPQEVLDVFGMGGAFDWDGLEPLELSGPSGSGAHVNESETEGEE